MVACAVAGVRRIRRGQLRAHRRLMLAASALVGLFLVAYAGKVGVLGKEERGAWLAHDYAVLYVHELCIAVMLLAGALAGYRAWRFRRTLGATPLERRSPLRGRVWHRRAGWTAVVASALAALTAAGVLAGMYARAG